MKKIIFLPLLLFAFLLQAQTEEDRTSWGRVLKAKGPDKYALLIKGNMHIGPQQDHPDNTFDFPNAAALEDILLFVEEGIATENLVYILAEDWDEWPDYVFDDNYALMPLEKVEAYLKEHKHLPEVISQDEVRQHGFSDKDMNLTLLKKIEELTLYTIEQHKALKAQAEFNAKLLERLQALEKQVKSQ